MSRDVSAVSDRVVWWTGHFKVAYTVGCVYTVGPTVCRVIHSTHGSEAFYHSHINLTWRLWGANSYVMYVTVCVCVLRVKQTTVLSSCHSVYLEKKGEASVILNQDFWVCIFEFVQVGELEVLKCLDTFFSSFFFATFFADCWGCVSGLTSPWMYQYVWMCMLRLGY